MDKYVVFLVVVLYLSSKANGRSWYHYEPREHYHHSDHKIVFEDYGDSESDSDSEEWEHSYSHGELGYKHPRNWNPDSVWFPGNSDEDRFVPSSSTRVPSRQVTTTPPMNINDCIRQCPKTPEYNPVCGTNRITYPNMGHLECARYCGLSVSLQRNSPCSAIQVTTSITPTESHSQRQCIESCPTTSEYNPICGTNNVTYRNRGGLECAKYCGVDVDLKRLSPCPTPITTEPPITDDQPWASFTQSTKAPDRVDFTISRDILDSIFSGPSTDSNEVDIDIRLGK